MLRVISVTVHSFILCICVLCARLYCRVQAYVCGNLSPCLLLVRVRTAHVNVDTLSEESHEISIILTRFSSGQLHRAENV
jgi:hypothetical protein